MVVLSETLYEYFEQKHGILNEEVSFLLLSLRNNFSKYWWALHFCSFFIIRCTFINMFDDPVNWNDSGSARYNVLFLFSIYDIHM